MLSGRPSAVYTSDQRVSTLTSFPRCGRVFPVGAVTCGRRLAPGFGGLRCRRHGLLADEDVLPAVLPRPRLSS